MAKNKLGFGIIGCGRVAPNHAQSLIELPDAELVAVADLLPDRADKFHKDYNAIPLTNSHDLITRDDIDVVNICLPSGLHKQVTLEALAAGKHVIVEKPIALSTNDANAMIQAAKDAGVKLCVILQNRYNPPMVELREAVESGKIGNVLLGNATVRWYRPQSYYEDGWHGTWSMDGGALMNQSIHHIDALQWLMGDVVSVFAYTGTLAHKMEAEDTGVAVLKFKSGALGTIEGSTIAYPSDIEGSVTIFGEKGSLKVGGIALNRKVLWRIEGEIENEHEHITADLDDPLSVYGSSHKFVIQDMIDAIHEDRQPQTHGAEGTRSLALIQAIYESARSGQPVEVKYG